MFQKLNNQPPENAEMVLDGPAGHRAASDDGYS